MVAVQEHHTRARAHCHALRADARPGLPKKGISLHCSPKGDVLSHCVLAKWLSKNVHPSLKGKGMGVR